MKTNLKTAKNSAIIALAATIIYIPLGQLFTTLIIKLSLRFFPSTSHFSIYALIFSMIPAAVYYFGMAALLAYVLIYLNNQKETENT